MPTGLSKSLKKKLEHLTAVLRQMQRVLIAYSGGIDSTLLLKVASQALGNNVLAVTVTSVIHPHEELEFAREITASLGLRHKVVKFDLLKKPSFVSNPVNRCYYCKREVFGYLCSVARKLKISFVLDGSNASDLEDFRPGSKARRELNVRSPLEECGISKQDIYKISRALNLPMKNKGTTVCFASRFPYGQPILLNDLKMIKQGEGYMRRRGFRHLRLRHYNLTGGLRLARIELNKNDMRRLAGLGGTSVANYLKGLGYDYITLDLEGYRPGSMNRFLYSNPKRQHG